MKINKIKTFLSSTIMGATLIFAGGVPAYADMPVVKIDGMDNVASSLQNFVKYIGLFFIAAGVVTFFFGAYKLFQSVKSQDSESRSTAILEIASGLGAAAVGFGANMFSGYIHL
ncbi:hypothetical protein FDA48_05790 [Clostridium botulinum]|nr:hypothetical protein [Clostridium botulinum]